MTGPVWPGCVLPSQEDVVEVDVSILHDPQQLATQLGVVLNRKDPVDALKDYELDDSNARGQLGTRR